MKLLYLLMAWTTAYAAIEVVVFDFGGVIAHTNHAMLYTSISEHFDISEEEARSLVKNPTYQDQLIPLFEKAIKPIPGMLCLVADLKKQGYQTAMLSNTVEVHARAICQKGLYRPFCPVVLSYQIGYAKPNPKAYEALLKQLGKQPSQCLFIDDKEENIQAARQMGMEAIHFTSYEQLQDKLKNKLITDMD